MDRNVLVLNMPKFKVKFGNEEYGYKSEKGKKNLKRVLAESSRGYCMYCYRRIVVDNDNRGHLEHSIEKTISSKLTECVPNIGIACAICNDSYKKRGERVRIPVQSAVLSFSANKCPKGCRKPCTAYNSLKKEYLKSEEAHIILQPLGVRGEDTHIELLLEYDVLKAEFQPDSRYKYSQKEILFLKDHIDRFCLNDKDRRTTQLIAFLKDTINNNGMYTKMEYNHLVVQLFAEQLAGKSSEQILKICECLYTYSVVKFQG